VFFGISNVGWHPDTARSIGLGETHDSVDRIRDIGEASGLPAIAIDGKRLTFESLDDEAGHDLVQRKEYGCRSNHAIFLLRNVVRPVVKGHQI